MTVDLKQLLSSKKFLPIYASRTNADKHLLGPVAVELHWTSTCNYRCIHCSYNSRRQTRYKLSKDVIRAVIDDLIKLDTQSVYLSGGGEPTTVRGWEGYAQQLMDNGIEIALITNGVALQKSHIDILQRMNYIAVSVYSTDEKEYKQITGSDLFEKQFALPSMIKHENKHAIVGARCVLNRINYKSIVSIYQHAISANFDYIIFIPAVDYEGVGINLRQEEINAVKNILQSCYEIFDLSKTNADNLLSRNIDYYEKADYRKDCKISMPVCKVVEIRGNAFVNYDGGVYLCQPHIGNETYCIGNVNEKKLKDIWNSERHLHVIELLHQQFASGICKKCRSISFNKAAYEHDINPSPLLNAVKDTFI